MKKQIVAAESFGKKAYAAPSVNFVNLDHADIICTSGNDVRTANPFAENEEEDW